MAYYSDGADDARLTWKLSPEWLATLADPDEEFTIMGWFKPRVDLNKSTTFLNYGSETVGNQNCVFETTASGDNFLLWFSNNSFDTGIAVPYSSEGDTNGWVNLCFLGDHPSTGSDKLSCLIWDTSGTGFGSGAHTLTTAGTHPNEAIHIGGLPSSGNTMDGWVGELKFWPFTLFKTDTLADAKAQYLEEIFHKGPLNRPRECVYFPLDSRYRLMDASGKGQQLDSFRGTADEIYFSGSATAQLDKLLTSHRRRRFASVEADNTAAFVPLPRRQRFHNRSMATTFVSGTSSVESRFVMGGTQADGQHGPGWYVESDAITLSIWIYLDSQSQQSDTRLITSQYDFNANQHCFMLSLTGVPTPTARFRVTGSTSNATLVSGTTLNAGEWYHILAVHDDSRGTEKQRLWTNNGGVVNSNVTIGTLSAISGAKTTIGNGKTLTTAPFYPETGDCWFAHAAIWSRALVTAERRLLALGVNPLQISGQLVSYYPLNSGLMRAPDMAPGLSLDIKPNSSTDAPNQKWGHYVWGDAGRSRGAVGPPAPVMRSGHELMPWRFASPVAPDANLVGARRKLRSL